MVTEGAITMLTTVSTVTGSHKPITMLTTVSMVTGGQNTDKHRLYGDSGNQIG